MLSLAIGVGAAVVVLGLRRDLSHTTRDGLPRLGNHSEQVTESLGFYEGEERRRRPLSPREMRLMGSLYLLLSVINAALAVLGGGLFYAVIAALWALAAVWWLKRSARAQARAVA